MSLRLVGFASPNHLKQTFGQAINHWWAGPLLTTQRKTTHTHRHKNGLQIIQNKGCVVVYQGKRRVRVGRVSNFVIFLSSNIVVLHFVIDNSYRDRRSAKCMLLHQESFDRTNYIYFHNTA